MRPIRRPTAREGASNAVHTERYIPTMTSLSWENRTAMVDGGQLMDAPPGPPRRLPVAISASADGCLAEHLPWITTGAAGRHLTRRPAGPGRVPARRPARPIRRVVGQRGSTPERYFRPLSGARKAAAVSCFGESCPRPPNANDARIVRPLARQRGDDGKSRVDRIRDGPARRDRPPESAFRETIPHVLRNACRKLAHERRGRRARANRNGPPSHGARGGARRRGPRRAAAGGGPRRPGEPPPQQGRDVSLGSDTSRPPAPARREGLEPCP
jgi:hypothetical protein